MGINGYEKASITALMYYHAYIGNMSYTSQKGKPIGFNKGSQKTKNKKKNKIMAKKKLYISLPITGFPIDEV